MPDRRNARTTRLLDPQWHWLTSARDRLYAEIEPGAQLVAAAITVIDADGTIISYSTDTASKEMNRTIIPDSESFVAGVLTETIDATVRDEETPDGH